MRCLWISAMLSLALTGCVGGRTPHERTLGLQLALWAPEQAEPTQYDEWGGSPGYAVSGTLVSVSEGIGDPGKTLGFGEGLLTLLSIADADGANWVLGLSLDNGTGDEPVPLDLVDGQSLSFEIVHGIGFADDLALVISDGDGLVLAGEEGWNTRLDALEPDPSGALSVTAGEAGGPRGRSGCGRTAGLAVQFSADDSTVLEYGERGPLTVDGVEMTARNLDAWTYEGQVTCTDTWGPMSWVVLR